MATKFRVIAMKTSQRLVNVLSRGSVGLFFPVCVGSLEHWGLDKDGARCRGAKHLSWILGTGTSAMYVPSSGSSILFMSIECTDISYLKLVRHDRELARTQSFQKPPKQPIWHQCRFFVCTFCFCDCHCDYYAGLKFVCSVRRWAKRKKFFSLELEITQFW
mmetsp:Transcript_11724/g.27146  ORF Transcript_11724/g.27146 Transcript_11724/m.27146 type:complete len:161 (+) Transcript_11724:1405-1887(+)